MPIQYTHEKQLLAKDHWRGTIYIFRVHCHQTDSDGAIIADLGTRYTVEQGEHMVPCRDIDRAEQVATEINLGERILGQEVA